MGRRAEVSFPRDRAFLQHRGQTDSRGVSVQEAVDAFLSISWVLDSFPSLCAVENVELANLPQKLAPKMPKAFFVCSFRVVFQNYQYFTRSIVPPGVIHEEYAQQ